MRQPILIDVLGAFSNPSDDELRSRHARYGQRVRDLTAGQVDSLLVLSKSTARTGQVVHERDGLTIISLGNSANLISLGRSAAKFAAQIPVPVTWIAGSPFREAVTCLLANQRHPGKVQVQAHGDFGRLCHVSRGMKDQLRWLLARKTLKSAHSIRAVSPMQLSELILTFHLAEDRCIVSPVPINKVFWEGNQQFPQTEGSMRVGYFGRIHKERGIQQWAEVASELARIEPALEFHIVGDGPDRESFRKCLEREISGNRVIFHGSLRGMDLTHELARLSVVLNTCQTEAYGRATLESLILGIPVVTLPSPGALFVRELFDPKRLLIAEPSDLVDCVITAVHVATSNLNTEFRNSVQVYEEHNVARLVETWV